MEALAEANADAKEIDETIRIGGDVALGIDDDDLAEELAGLVEEAEREDQEEEDVEEIRRRLSNLSPTAELADESPILERESPALDREKVPVLAA